MGKYFAPAARIAVALLVQLRNEQEYLMSELETKSEAEDFTDELSDEALDRWEEESRFCAPPSHLGK
jgi:hypothetical protein